MEAGTGDVRQRRTRRCDLEPIVCCPQCRGELRAVSAVRDTDGLIREGRLFCRDCDTDRAAVRDYRMDFLRPAQAILAAPPGLDVPPQGERRFDARSAEVGLYGPWTPVDDFVCASGTGDSVAVCEGLFSGASLRFLKNAHSGVVNVQCDDEPPISIDLYRPEGSLVEAVPVARDLPFGRHRLTVRATGRKHPASLDTQVILQEIVLHGPVDAGFDPRTAGNRGNPYSVWTLRHLAALPADPLILEIGGGDRRTANPRHINLEYLPYELADCFGDVHRLPFRDATFDAVCSQAVFEHVRHPYAAAEELVRIVRPGGVILTEVAFLQPLHGVPHHYFNMTIDGLKAIFDGCVVFDEGWFGDFGQTVSWMADVAGVKGRLPPGTWPKLADLLSLLDGELGHDGRKFIASGTRLAVRRPEESP